MEYNYNFFCAFVFILNTLRLPLFINTTETMQLFFYHIREVPGMILPGAYHTNMKHYGKPMVHFNKTRVRIFTVVTVFTYNFVNVKKYTSASQLKLLSKLNIAY